MRVKFILFFFLLADLVSGQEALQLSYSLLENKSFYFINKKEDGILSICNAELKFDDIPRVTDMKVFEDDKSSICWDIDGNMISYTSKFGNKNGIQFKLHLDTLEKRNIYEKKRFYDSIAKDLNAKYPDDEDYFDAMLSFSVKESSNVKSLGLRIPTRIYALIAFYGKDSESFAFSFINILDGYLFYIRYGDEISIWNFHSSDNSWKEQKTYSFDSNMYFKASKDFLPGEENFKFNSIKDSLFFQGHFKAIRQNDNIFIVNQDHGAIYWIGDEAIYKVGQVDIGNYKYQVLNQNLFIEDKDNEQIIFFSKVEKLSNEHPFPKVHSIITEKEYTEKFKIVLKNIDYSNN